MTTLEKAVKRGDIQTAKGNSTVLPDGRKGKSEDYRHKMDASNNGKIPAGLPDCK